MSAFDACLLAELENIEPLVPAYWQGFENIELLMPLSAGRTVKRKWEAHLAR